MALSVTLTVNEALENPVTRDKLRDLVRTATGTVGGTVETAQINNGAVTEAKVASALLAELRGIFGRAVEAACPVGKVDMFVDSVTLPAGWVLCDGGSYVNAEYPAVAKRRTAGTDPFVIHTEAGLYAAGSFTVPDLRNQFVRVWQTGKSLTAAQEQSVGRHRHGLLGKLTTPSGAVDHCRDVAQEGVIAGVYGTGGSAVQAAVEQTNGGRYLVGETGGDENVPAHRYLVFAVYVGERVV